MPYRTPQELEAGLAEILQSPADAGRLALIVRRPLKEQREVLATGQLDQLAGLVGDAWRSSNHSPFVDQLTLMNSRVIALLAGDESRWPPAGDQLFVDLDLSRANLPPGTRLEVGEAVIEITAQPHLGCGKFARRFGPDALAFVNSPAGRAHNLRGIYARVIRSGAVRVADVVKKLPTE